MLEETSDGKGDLIRYQYERETSESLDRSPNKTAVRESLPEGFSTEMTGPMASFLQPVYNRCNKYYTATPGPGGGA
jgi:hypothetical protein